MRSPDTSRRVSTITTTAVLSVLILLPIVAAIALLLGAPARKTAVIAAAAHFALALVALLSYDRATGGFQFLGSSVLVPEWDLKYLVAADGLSLVMLFLTALVTLAAVWVTPKIERRENLFYACLLFITAGATGAFASQDLFFFYAFHELALIPTFLLIGLWGSGDRHAAAWKITIYLALGSFILLIGLVDLYHSVPEGRRTFDMIKLAATADLIPSAAQARPYLLLLLGFGILISLFPFHSWAPQAYASAPTAAAMLHAGVLKKFGLYGLIRLALPLLPDGAQRYAGLLLVLLVGNIIYIGLVTIAQKRLDLMLGYSSVMHMGYIFLGIGALNVVGVSGAALLMLAHGLSIAALFAIAGQLRARVDSLAFEEMGGLAKSLPFLSLAFGLAAFASIGLPGFANFASELMIFFGAFKPAVNDALAGQYKVAVGFALWGVVISAVYMLRAYRAIFWGEPRQETPALTDPVFTRRLPIALLIGALLIGGFLPRSFLAFIQPSVEALLR
ncbi:MAG: NADH-quinone oxidoreductase subunit M [Verrucomicrobiota bacterium]|nr:NADH-quinone oxidoreductase subunit M [Verrucomicrobiota bacterium]